MPVPGGLSSRQITVTHTGAVNVSDYFYSTDVSQTAHGEVKEYQLSPVSAFDMLMIGQALGEIKGGGLEKATGIECQDAPGYIYEIYKNLTKITIFQVFNCQPRGLKDKAQRAQAGAIKNFLDRLMSSVIPGE